MFYVIIALAVIGGILALGKYILLFLKYALYSPKVNSIIYIINGLLAVPMTPPITWVFIMLAIIDCIRDVKIHNSFYLYRDAESTFGRDRLFNRKSIAGLILMIPIAILTRSLPYALIGSMIPRAVFLIIVYPYISYSVIKEIRKNMKAGYPVSLNYGGAAVYIGIPPILYRSKRYYYDKHIKRLIAKEKLISNESMENTSSFKVVYLSAAFFKKYPKRIAEVMLAKGTVRLCTIKEFEELKDLNLTMLIDDSNSWSEPFITAALKSLVGEGILKEENLSDFFYENPQYRHVNGVPMKSNDLNALLDEDEL